MRTLDPCDHFSKGYCPGPSSVKCCTDAARTEEPAAVVPVAPSATPRPTRLTPSQASKVSTAAAKLKGVVQAYLNFGVLTNKAIAGFAQCLKADTALDTMYRGSTSTVKALMRGDLQRRLRLYTYRTSGWHPVTRSYFDWLAIIGWEQDQTYRNSCGPELLKHLGYTVSSKPGVPAVVAPGLCV